jgi:hypothetical protein
MEIHQFYSAEIDHGDSSRRIVFYATVAGAGSDDPAYISDQSWVLHEYEGCVEEIAARTHVLNGTTRSAVDVQIPRARQITQEEMVGYDPSLHAKVIRAIDLGEAWIGQALHPIRMVWCWQTADKDARRNSAFGQAAFNTVGFNGSLANAELVVSLRISDDTPATFAGTLTDRQLSDQFLTERQISKIYGNLLEYRSHKQLEQIIAASATSEVS